MSGDVPRIGMPALLQRLGELQRGLSAKLHDDAEQRAVLLLLMQDFQHVLGGQRLEIEAVRGVVVGRDGLRVAVDHDGLEPGLIQREAGVAAAIVELDALADAVRPAAEDDDLLAVRGPRFVRRLARERRRVGRVHVGGGGGELRRAGVDALVDGQHVERPAALGDLLLAAASRAWRGGRPKSPWTSAAGTRPSSSAGRGCARGSLSRRCARSARGTTCRSCRPRRSVRRRSRAAWPAPPSAAGPASGVPSAARMAFLSSPWPRPSISISSRPCSPVSSERSAFCSDSWNVRPIAMASPTDFIDVVSVFSAPGNFSNAKRGILVTT